MSVNTPIETVLSQIDAAKDELSAYPPRSLDWHRRCIETAEQLVPWLQSVAPKLKTFIEEVANSKHLVRRTWQAILAVSGDSIPREFQAAMDRELDREAVLMNDFTGDIASKLVESFLVDSFDGDLASNGRSDYPDLFLRSKCYDDLPDFERIKDESAVYGAARKGALKRPVRVPDGLEIKTCKEKFYVDCHHAHAGLHLAVLFQKREGLVEVLDVLTAFLALADYRITKPRTPTTTLKASFNGKCFVSLLSHPPAIITAKP